jgi:hypothetical protein
LNALAETPSLESPPHPAFQIITSNFCNTPSIVDFSFSMQRTDLATPQGMEDQISKFVHDTAAASGLDVSNYQNVWSLDPGMFDETAISCVDEAAKEMGYSYDKLCSISAMNPYTPEWCARQSWCSHHVEMVFLIHRSSMLVLRTAVLEFKQY